MNRLAILWMSLSCLFLIACTSVEEQQARLEQARAAYRVQQHSARTAEAQQKLAAWQSALGAAAYAEFKRTEETLGDVVPPVKAVKVTGAELKELLAIIRCGHPVPLPDADILTAPGTEPLRLNEDGDVEYLPYPQNNMQDYLSPPRNFFAIDMLYFCDAKGNVIEPGLAPFSDIVSVAEATQEHNSWAINNERPFIMLEDADYQRFRKLPSYRRFVERMKKAHATGKWDITPDFSEL